MNEMQLQIDESWRSVLRGQFESASFASLMKFVDDAYSQGVVYPPRNLIFEAFNRTPFDCVKVVLLGQDPYHEPGQAQGLSFSVPADIPIPPSLRNIYKELEDEYHTSFADRTGDVSSWADQGVLMLNATLTVPAGQAGAHRGRGWEVFTDAVVHSLASRRNNLVFILWGASAQRKGKIIDRSRHLVLESAHPSPLSAYRGFFGCNHFIRTNEYLESRGIAPIEW